MLLGLIIPTNLAHEPENEEWPSGKEILGIASDGV